jgi:hypothetical protein
MSQKKRLDWPTEMKGKKEGQAYSYIVDEKCGPRLPEKERQPLEKEKGRRQR